MHMCVCAYLRVCMHACLELDSVRSDSWRTPTLWTPTLWTDRDLCHQAPPATCMRMRMRAHIYSARMASYVVAMINHQLASALRGWRGALIERERQAAIIHCMRSTGLKRAIRTWAVAIETREATLARYTAGSL